MFAGKMSIKPYLTVIAATVALASFALAFPAAGQGAETGINSQDLSAPDTVSRASDLHAKWIRRFVRWDTLQPTRGGAFNSAAISYLDELTSLAAIKGHKVQLTLIGSPQWANGSSDYLVPPSNPSEFARTRIKRST